MPIGVPLIICGSIALVGSGYAFKKLVYDQHLAHYIEAFIANHLPTTSGSRLAAPVSAQSIYEGSTSGTTSAWSKGVNRLRRRKASHEDGEPLISLEERPQSIQDISESKPIRPRAVSPNLEHESGFHQHDAEGGCRDEEAFKQYRSKQHSLPKEDSQGPTSSIHQSHDDEIKSSIFNSPPGLRTSHSYYPSAERDQDTHQLQPPTQEAGPSGTFSFLSLGESQVSSPEAPAAMLDSMSFSHFSSVTGRSENGARLEHRSVAERDELDRRDEVMSIPDTGYTSEAFSNISSPRSGHRSPFEMEGNGRSDNGSMSIAGGEGGGLGLAVEDLGMSFVPLIPVRRTGSVVSFSGSEEEGEGGSDWERVSVARST